MKVIKFLPIVLLIFSLATLSGCSDANADSRTVNLSIEGMTCEAGCAKLIEKTLAKTEGVIDDKVNFNEKSAVVEYDANKIGEADIVTIIEKLGEYSAEVKTE